MMRTDVIGWSLLGLGIGLLAAPGEGRAAPPAGEAAPAPAPAVAEDDDLYRCARAAGEVQIRFRPGLELAELATWAMGFTCKSFVYSPRLASRVMTVTVMAPRPMTSREAWRLFLVSLEIMDLTLVPRGRMYEIVESPTAKKSALPLHRPGGEPPAGEEMIRALFRPRQVSSANLAQALAALASRDGEIADLGWAGVVLVTDHGEHIARMREIIEEIDRPGTDQGLYVVPLRYAPAAGLLPTLRALLAPEPAPAGPRPKGAPEGGGGSPAQLLADERTNALILLASRAAFERARALIERLDIDVEGAGSGRVHVHFLEHTSAVKIAETLTSLIGQRAPRQASAPNAPGPAEDQSVSLQGDARVTADPLSNSLLILSSERDYLALKEILRQLDSPRNQVFIEALIIEVGSGWSRAVGAAWHGGRMTRDALWLGSLGHGSALSPLLQPPTPESGVFPPTGFLGGVIGLPIPGAQTLLGTSIPSFSVLFQALAENHFVDILSAPHIMTTDHVEALLSSGQKVLFQNGVAAVPGSNTVTPTFGREDVALTLKVTPHVGVSGRVRLDIDLVLEDALPGGGPAGPATSKRQIKNSVVVGDQESAVLGGLVTRRITSQESKIPLLGDLPVLGVLFRRRVRAQEEANLIVLVTPYVLTDSVDGVRTVERVLERRAEFLDALDRLKQMGFRPGGDGRRMRGLIAEIARRQAQIDEQREVLRRLDRSKPGPAGPIEPAPPPALERTSTEEPPPL